VNYRIILEESSNYVAFVMCLCAETEEEYGSR